MGVSVGVKVAVMDGVGVGVFVHLKAVAVCMVEVILACVSGDKPQAESGMKTNKMNTNRVNVGCRCMGLGEMLLP